MCYTYQLDTTVYYLVYVYDYIGDFVTSVYPLQVFVELQVQRMSAWNFYQFVLKLVAKRLSHTDILVLLGYIENKYFFIFNITSNQHQWMHKHCEYQYVSNELNNNSFHVKMQQVYICLCVSMPITKNCYDLCRLCVNTWIIINPVV